jgi:hypothetical protein
MIDKLAAQLGVVTAAIQKLKNSLGDLHVSQEHEEMKASTNRELEQIRASIRELSSLTGLKSVELPMNPAKSKAGILSYLPKKYRGNVHEKRIVAIISKSVYHDPEPALTNVADLTVDSWLFSQDEPVGLLGFPSNACRRQSLPAWHVVSEILGH